MSATPRRPIRVLVAKPGLDGHDVGAKLVTRALMRAGMEVIYTGLRRSHEEIAQAALEEDVDVIGLSILSGAHLPLCGKLAAALRARGLSDVVWIVGGNIPRRDHTALGALGVNGIFPTGTPFDAVVGFIEERVTR
ncbi:MAG: cobalamin-dependent protein [Vicinamibacterales bacterium]|nr:methylmalonyl-CoA mutase [Acidobacteriota bacterium]MDP7670549.1 cobalamin-dependent protein [Vicinamibacterales bacterium]HJO38206.1 cobalamin-dependent protein [Vicinamibacterales bacterium]